MAEARELAVEVVAEMQLTAEQIKVRRHTQGRGTGSMIPAAVYAVYAVYSLWHFCYGIS
jgi:hypothetical protein